MGTFKAIPPDQHHHLTSTGVDLHLAEWSPPPAPRMAILMVPGTGSHTAYYGRFATALQQRGFHPFAVDFKGHGASGGRRGEFTLAEMVQNVGDAARFIVARTGLRVVLVGTSQGGEVAFHALQAVEEAKAAVCHNILLSTLFPINAGVRLLQSPLAGLAAKIAGRVPIPLLYAFNWKKAYLDPGLLEEKKQDPLAVWWYTLGSYRTVFTTKPVIPPAGNHKPVMVAVGERDEICPPEHCLKCFCALGGPKEFYVMPGAMHQLVVDYSEAFADVVSDFFRRHLETGEGVSKAERRASAQA